MIEINYYLFVLTKNVTKIKFAVHTVIWKIMENILNVNKIYHSFWMTCNPSTMKYLFIYTLFKLLVFFIHIKVSYANIKGKIHFFNILLY